MRAAAAVRISCYRNNRLRVRPPAGPAPTNERRRMVWYYYLVAAGFGLIFGSFFNVVIYRVPRHMTLGDRSACPGCGATIRCYDNVPILSFVFLRGRCRGCSGRISVRYPLVEALNAGLFVLMYWWSRGAAPSQMGTTAGQVVSPELFIGLLLSSVLLIVAAVDIDHGIVPNRVMYPGTVMMMMLVTGIGLYRRQPGRIGLSLATAAIGGGFLLGAGLLYGFFFLKGLPMQGEEPVDAPGNAGSREDGKADLAGARDRPEGQDGEEEEEDSGVPTGIGMGDVKLIFFCGLALGFFHWYFVVVQVLVGFALGGLASIPVLIFTGKGRKDRIPFAPFLAAGAVVALVWGQQLVDLYLKLLR